MLIKRSHTLIIQLLLTVVVSGCTSVLQFKTVDYVSWEMAIDGNGSASWNAESEDGQLLVSALKSCTWKKSYIDPPLSSHRFYLEKSDEPEQVFGQFVENDIYIDGGPDLYVCHISDAEAARFRSMYDGPENGPNKCFY